MLLNLEHTIYWKLLTTQTQYGANVNQRRRRLPNIGSVLVRVNKKQRLW